MKKKCDEKAWSQVPLVMAITDVCSVDDSVLREVRAEFQDLVCISNMNHTGQVTSQKPRKVTVLNGQSSRESRGTLALNIDSVSPMW
jgi:hypothetical protein